MFDYSEQIEAFRDEKVRLPKEFREKLFKHRDANRDRLISRLPDRINGLSISQSSFKPQGSSAVKTIIQTKFIAEEYDIDDGLVLLRSELIDESGKELSSEQVKKHVLEALKDDRFAKQPSMAANAVRVFYKEDDEERHHIDFPVYRKFVNADGQTVREIAGEFDWVESDPTQVNHWFLSEVKNRNEIISGKGTQMRHLIQLLKRFCRSRYDWDMPSGMKLTMLVAECQPAYYSRIDLAFRKLLEKLKVRLESDKVILNLAHPDKPALTRSKADNNVTELLTKIDEALKQLKTLDHPDNQNTKQARDAWDSVFKSDGYFLEYDKKKEAKAKEARLEALAANINAGTAKTSSFGAIGSVGVSNLPHRFYGGKSNRMRTWGKCARAYRQFIAQKLMMNKFFPIFNCTLGKRHLTCIGQITPAEGCDTYTVKIDYPQFGVPVVRILNKGMEINSKTHCYEDGSLCLYYPPESPWKLLDNLHSKLVPWIAEWLVFYELYLIKGKWLGKAAPHPIKNSPPTQGESF